MDDGRDAVAATASVACIFTTGPDTRPLLAHPSLLCRCSPLCMYAYVVRTVEHLHAGQACRTYFRYHISARSARVIDSTRISPHVPPFHGQPEESRKATRFRKIENCQMLDENELRAVYRRLFYSPWSSTSCCTGSWRERRRRGRFVDTFYRNHHHHHHQNFPSLLERQVHGNRMAHCFFIQSPTSSSFSASLMYA